MKVEIVQDTQVEGRDVVVDQRAIVPAELGEQMVDEGVAVELLEDEPGAFLVMSRQREDDEPET